MGGLSTYVTRVISEFLFFFSFFFVFFVHLLIDRDDLYAKTHVSGQGCAFRGSVCRSVQSLLSMAQDAPWVM